MQSVPKIDIFSRTANVCSPIWIGPATKALWHRDFWWYGNVPGDCKVVSTRTEVCNADPDSVLHFWSWGGLFHRVELMQLSQQELMLCPFLPVETRWRKAATLNQRVQIQGGARARNQKAVYRYFDNLSFYHSTGPRDHLVRAEWVSSYGIWRQSQSTFASQQASPGSYGVFQKGEIKHKFSVLLSEKIQSVLSLGA